MTVSKHVEPLIDIYKFKCKLGHEFIDVVPAGGISYYTFARSKELAPDKPAGGVCCQCNSSIALLNISHGVVQMLL